MVGSLVYLFNSSLVSGGLWFTAKAVTYKLKLPIYFTAIQLISDL